MNGLDEPEARREKMLRRAGVKKLAVGEASVPEQVGPDDELWRYLDPAFRALPGASSRLEITKRFLNRCVD